MSLAPLLLAARELGDQLLLVGQLDECSRPLETGLFLLRADHPPDRRTPVGRGLLREELRGLRVLCQQAGIGLGELAGPLLVGINTRLVFPPRLERPQASRSHPVLRLQRLYALDVDRAPDTGRFARAETDRITDRIDAPADTVDPPEAQRLIDGLR